MIFSRCMRIRLRFSTKTVDRRLDEIIRDCRKLRASAGFWVGPDSKPSDLEDRLRTRGLLCKKRCVAMACHVQEMKEPVPSPEAEKIRLIEEYSIFEEGGVEHPTIGKIATSVRRSQLQTFVEISRFRPQRTWHFMAYLHDAPIATSTLHIGAGVAGIYDVGVVKAAQRQGIGTAVTLFAYKFAQDMGYNMAVLLASRTRTSMYRHLGFIDVCRMSYWYFPRTRWNP